MAKPTRAHADADLELLIAMEREAARLRAEGVVDDATADALRTHYRRRLEVAQA